MMFAVTAVCCEESKPGQGAWEHLPEWVGAPDEKPDGRSQPSKVRWSSPGRRIPMRLRKPERASVSEGCGVGQAGCKQMRSEK